MPKLTTWIFIRQLFSFLQLPSLSEQFVIFYEALNPVNQFSHQPGPAGLV